MKTAAEVLAYWFIAFIGFAVVAKLFVFFFGKEYAALVLVFTFIAVLVVNQQIISKKRDEDKDS